MKNIIFTILSCFLLFSCASYNESTNLNIQKAELAHSKFNNMNNDLSYNEHKSLIVEYAKNSEYPDLK
tara:strand:+ start:858 stop:1061 length:204 start_codon:yes stop_codon:yes gene_type:complete